jgi:hypothetical protein
VRRYFGDCIFSAPAARLKRSIEPCHFASSVAAGFDANTSNPRNALAQKYRLAQVRSGVFASNAILAYAVFKLDVITKRQTSMRRGP